MKGLAQRLGGHAVNRSLAEASICRGQSRRREASTGLRFCTASIQRIRGKFSCCGRGQPEQMRRFWQGGLVEARYKQSGSPSACPRPPPPKLEAATWLPRKAGERRRLSRKAAPGSCQDGPCGTQGSLLSPTHTPSGASNRG